MDRFVHVKIIKNAISFFYISIKVPVFKIKYGIYMNVWYNAIIKCRLFASLMIKERIVTFFNVTANKV